MRKTRGSWWLWAALAAAGVGIVIAADIDGDSMDDAYEDRFGLSKTNAADASLNFDDDALTNAQEAVLLTDPFEGDTDKDGWKDDADADPLSRAIMMWGHPRFTAGDSYQYTTRPQWWLGASKSGGAWTNGSWHVEAEATNDASLLIHLDRASFSNSVRVDITLIDRVGAVLETDLLATNGAAVATNLFGNLILGSDIEVMRQVSVDLPAHPLAGSIRLRRGAGEITIYETVVYVDEDGDGLDAPQELQVGTSDLIVDSDSDGWSDRYEVDAGTSPVSAFSHPQGPITLGLPADVLVACNGDTSPTGAGHAVAVAECPGVVTVTYSDSSAGTCPQFIHRVWTAVDSCSNQVAGTQTIALADSLNPDDIALTREDQSVAIPVLLNDETAGTLIAVSKANHGTVTYSGDILTYTPSSNFVGRDTFVYMASNSTSGATVKSVNVLVHKPIDAGAARTTLLEGVSTVASAVQPGHQVVYGPEAYAIAWYPEGPAAGALIAAGSFGAGRVVSVPDHQMADMGSYGGTYDSGVFYRNAVAWLAGTTSRTIRIVTYNSGTRTWLQAQGYSDVVLAGEGTLASLLPGASVFVGGWMGSTEPDSNIRALADFALAGGGLLIADYGPGYSWWWGQPLYQAPGNRLLREAGIGFSAGNRWEEGSIVATNGATGQVDAQMAMAIIADESGHSQAEKDQAGYTLNGIYDALAPDDLLLAEFDEVFQARIQTINPTPTSPVSDSFKRSLLRREATILQQLPASDVTKHRTADALYGAISNDAQRVTRSVHIDTSRTRWHATGLYAPPGEVVSVVVPQSAVGHGFSVTVNQNNQDSLDGLGSYYRMPRVTRSFAVTSRTIEVANAFGGLIHFSVGGGAASGQSTVSPFDIEVSGAVEAPFFVLGVTSDTDWNNSIRAHPGRQAELVSGNLTITLPANYVRTLSNPTALMTYWNEVVGRQDELGGWPTQRLSAERINLDVQISAGWAHSGYPIQGPWEHGRMMMDLSLERTTMDWGMYHELGHNHQAGWWTFDVDGELTVNVFANYCVETMLTQPAYSGPGWRYCANQLETLNAASNAVAVGGAYSSKGNRWPFWFQLADGFGWDAYRQVFEGYRLATNGLPSSEQEKRDQWLIRFSEESGYNLAPFMCEVWGLEASSTAVAQVSSLPAWMPIASGYADAKTIVPPNTAKTFNLGEKTLGMDGIATIVGVSQPGHGTISNTGAGAWTYTPATGYAGADQFSYDVISSVGNTVNVQVAIDVSPKGVLREVWSGIAGTTLAALKTNALYPANPTESSIVPDLAQSPDRADTYGVRMRAWLVPPATGNYTFWIASDDEGELWLSTDDNPSNVTLIANVPGYSDAYELTKYTQQKSAAISLVAGRRYYVEALMKEGAGGDNLSVAWEVPGMAREYIVPQQYLLAYGVTNHAPELGNDAVTTTVNVPVNVNVLANDVDPDGDVIAIASFTQGAHGAVAAGSAGVLSYTPSANHFGPDTFSYTVADGRGGVATANVTVTTSDINPPVLSCPQSMTVECGASVLPAFTGSPVVSDEDLAPSIAYTDSVALASCPNVQVITRTWTALDASGNSASCVQIITVNDTLAPVLTIPSNVVVECGAPTDTNATGSATATDACGSATVTFADSTSPLCGNTYVIVRIWTATDACLNQATATQTITVVDTTAPLLVLPSDTTVECGASTDTNATGSAVGTDGCGGVSITFVDVTSNTCGEARIIHRVWTATDACSNQTSGTQTVTVVDSTPPVLILPSNAVASCGGDLSPALLGMATAVVSACGTDTVSWTDTLMPYDASPTGLAGLSLWLRADAGVLTNGAGTVTEWQDQSGNGRHLSGGTTKPALAQNALNGLPGVRFDGTTMISRTNWLPSDWPSSNCAIFVVSKSAAIQNTYMIETVDSTGNPPSGNRMLMHWPWGGTAYWDFGNISANGRLSFSYDGGTNDFHLWHVSSYAGIGQAIYADGVLKASDANVSVLSPGSLKLQLGRSYKGDLMEVIIFNRPLTNEETTRLGYYLSRKYNLVTSYRAPEAGTIARVWTASDACGHAVSATQRITLVDVTSPAITAPADAVVECSGSTEPVMTGSASANDACDPAPGVTYTDTLRIARSALKAIYPFNESSGATVVNDVSASNLTGSIYEAVCGQAGACAGGIKLDGTNDYVNLGTGPSIGSSGDFAVSVWFKSADTNGGYIVSQRDSDSDGYAGGYYLGINSAGRPLFHIWSWYYSDSRVATGTNIVNDGQWHHLAGVRRSSQSIHLYLDGQLVATNTAFSYSMYGTISTYVGANKRDNNNFLMGTVDDLAIWNRALSPREVSSLQRRGVEGISAASMVQTIERTWKAADYSGNTSFQTQTVATIDTAAPALTLPPDTMVECGQGSAPTNTGVATATDGCSVPVVTYADTTSASCGGTFAIDRLWKALDGYANVACATQRIVIVDTTAPALTVPGDAVVECTQSTATNTTGAASATDGCGPVLITYSDVSELVCGNSMIIARVWSATDSCSNRSVATQLINVVDTTAPILVVPSNVTVECGAGTATNVTGLAQATDGCGPVTLSYSDAFSNTCGSAGVLSRVWTSVDACFNATIKTQVITVVDTTAPVLTVPSDATIGCGDDASAAALGMATVAVSSCGTDYVSHDDTLVPFAPSPTGMVGLSLWLRADLGVFTDPAGRVASWQDQSGSGYVLDGGAAKPSLVGMLANRKPAIRFDGTTALSATSSLPAGWPVSNCTVFVVSRATALQNAYLVETTDATGNPPSTNRLVLHLPFGSVAYWDFGNINANGRLSYTYDGGTNDVHVWSARSWAGVGQSIYSDGVLKASDATTSLFNPSGLKLQLGRSFKGELLELLVFNRPLTETESSSVGVYLSLRYGLPTAYRSPSSATLMRRWTATDACGNATLRTQSIFKVDAVAPTLVGPADTTVACGSSLDPENLGAGVITDDCDTNPVITYQDDEALLIAGRKVLFPMDEPVYATLIVSHDRAVTGVVYGAARGDAGQVAGGLRLDGSDDYVDLGTIASIDGAGDFTVAAWVKSTDTNGGFILSQRDPDGDGYAGGYFLGLNGSGRPLFQIYSWYYSDNRVATGSVTIADGQWHHIVGIRLSNKAIKLYVDGTLVATNTAFGYGMYGYTSTYIGANKRDNNNFLSGTVDDVGIWNRALSEREIGALVTRAQAGKGAAGLISLIDRRLRVFDHGGNYSGMSTQRICVADDSAPSLTIPSNVTIAASTSAMPTQTGYATALDLCDATPLITWSDSDSVLSPGIAAHYTFDDGASATNFADSSGGGRIGTKYGAVTVGIPGMASTAVDLTRSQTSRVSVASALNLYTNKVTFSAWMKRRGSQNQWAGIVFCRAGGTVAGLNFGTGNELRYHWNNQAATYNWNSGLIPPEGVWTFVALVVEPDRTTIYMGVPGSPLAFAVNSVSNSMEEFNGALTIGQDSSQASRCLDGSLDDVAIWRRALSPAEITHLYRLGSSGGTVLPAPSDTNIISVARTWAARDDAGFTASGQQAITVIGASADSDGDSLGDYLENVIGTDPNNADTDGDGLSDGQEINTHRSDPLGADADFDGIPDGWEVAHGLNPLDVLDGAKDIDGDGFSSFDEYMMGFDPNTSDAALVTDVQVVNGCATSACLGAWAPYGTEIRALNRRGYVEYEVSAPTAAVYRICLTGGAMPSYVAFTNTYDLAFSVDGQYVQRNTLVSYRQSNAATCFMTPYLTAGVHTVRAYWDNAAEYRSLRVRTVKLQSIGGTDTNANGRADWMDQWIAGFNTVVTTNESSLVSPAFLEGRSRFAEMALINGSNVQRGVGRRWYANLPLSEGAGTSADLNWEAGATTASIGVSWKPFDIMSEGTITLRKGDSLLLAAVVPGESNLSTTIRVDGSVVSSPPSFGPVVYTFATSGAHEVSAVLQGVSTYARTVAVHVVDGSFAAPAPIVWVGSARSWVNPAFPATCVMEIDPRFSVGRSPALGGQTLSAQTPESGMAVGRLFKGGPILTATPVKGFNLFTDAKTYDRIIEVYQDGSYHVETVMVVSPLPSDVVIHVDMFIAGVTFDDGTIHKEFTAADFDVLGQKIVRFIHPPGNQYSVCHHVSVYQNGVRLGGW